MSLNLSIQCVPYVNLLSSKGKPKEKVSDSTDFTTRDHLGTSPTLFPSLIGKSTFEWHAMRQGGRVLEQHMSWCVSMGPPQEKSKKQCPHYSMLAYLPWPWPTHSFPVAFYKFPEIFLGALHRHGPL